MSNQTKLSSCSLQRTPLTDDDLVNVAGGAPKGNLGQTFNFNYGDAYENNNNLYIVTAGGSYLSGNNVPCEKFTSGQAAIKGNGISTDVPAEDLSNTNLFNVVTRPTTYIL